MQALAPPPEGMPSGLLREVARACCGREVARAHCEHDRLLHVGQQGPGCAPREGFPPNTTCGLSSTSKHGGHYSKHIHQCPRG